MKEGILKVADLPGLLGPCVLLRCSGKKAVQKGWNQLTIEEMTPAYLSRLKGNVGVLLGEPSGGLCTIDIDSDESVDAFLALNPLLQNTLRTRGRRGCNLWVRINGPFPKLIKPTLNGQHWGEWRSNGGYTIIRGTHPDTDKPYTVQHHAKPIVLRFEQITWPEGINVPASPSGVESKTPLCPLHSSESSSISPLSAESASSALSTSGLIARVAGDLARAKAGSNDPLDKLFSRFIAAKYRPSRGTRNAYLVGAVTFLYHCVSEEAVFKLCTRFYDENRHHFTDSPEQHQRELAALVTGVKETYLSTLNPIERGLHDTLGAHDARMQDAFRILRDLGKKSPDGSFFMAYGELATRLLMRSGDTAYRIMLQFEQWGIVEMVEKGLQRAPGVKVKATVWRYLL